MVLNRWLFIKLCPIIVQYKPIILSKRIIEFHSGKLSTGSRKSSMYRWFTNEGLWFLAPPGYQFGYFNHDQPHHSWTNLRLRRMYDYLCDTLFGIPMTPVGPVPRRPRAEGAFHHVLVGRGSEQTKDHSWRTTVTMAFMMILKQFKGLPPVANPYNFHG